jgi:hypothetical protein
VKSEAVWLPAGMVANIVDSAPGSARFFSDVQGQRAETIMEVLINDR